MVNALDVFRFTLEATFLAQKVINVFHYVVETLTADDDFLVNASDSWLTDVFTTWWSVQAGQVYNERLTVENLSDIDRPFYTRSVNQAGGYTGEVLPSFNSVSFKYNVGTRKTRAGGKRLAGILESDTTGNGLTPTSLTTKYQILAGQLQEVVEVFDPVVGAIATLAPIVLKKYTGDVPTVADWQRVLSVTVSPFVTTQSSRKVGYGS